MSHSQNPTSVSRRQTVPGSRRVRAGPLVRGPKGEQVVAPKHCAACADRGGSEADLEDQTLGSSLARDASTRRAQSVGEMRVGAVMQTRVRCFASDTPIDEVAAALLGQGLGGAPVVDAAGRLIGVVSLTDVVRASRSSGGCAADIMTPACCALPASAHLARAAALMAFEGIHRVPIVCMQNKVVGIVSALDVMRALAQVGGFMLPAEVSNQVRAQERQNV